MVHELVRYMKTILYVFITPIFVSYSTNIQTVVLQLKVTLYSSNCHSW